MIRRAVDEICPQGSTQLLLEVSNNLGSSIRNDGLGHIMHTQDASNIQFSVFLSPVGGVHRNEMSRLGEPINGHPDRVKHMGNERQTHNEIHADVFPFPGRDIQRVHLFDRSHMIGLDSLTRVAFCNIASSLVLNSSTPELHLQIMIHLHATRVDGIFVSMSFIEYLLTQLMVLWNHQMVLEPKSALIIHTKTVDLRITLGQPPLDMCDSIITALSCNDFPSQQWGEGHIILSHVWRYSNAGFFLVMLIVGS
jgi:hypothetical protein